MLEIVQSNLKSKKGRPSKRDLLILTRIKESLEEVHILVKGVCAVSDSKHPKKIHRKIETFTVKK